MKYNPNPPIYVDETYPELVRFFENKEDANKARLEGEAKYHKDFAPQNKLFSQYNIEEERYGNINKTEEKYG